MPKWRISPFRNGLYITWPDPSIASGRRRYSLGTSDRKEAERRAPARYAQLTRPVGTTVAAIWKGYVTDKEGLAVLETMKSSWKALKDRFGSLEAEEVSIADCRAHITERRNAGIADNTLNTELGHLRTVVRWAEKHQRINRAPYIERPPRTAPKEGYLTREEISMLIGAASHPHLRLAIVLMIGTGARNAAAMQLTWDRVDFERRVIQLSDPSDRARRKGRAIVPINDSLFTALQAAKKGALTDHVIEWGEKPVKSIKRGLKTAGKKIGRPDVSAHMLRHSAAVWLAEDGHDMYEIAQFLGHSDVKTTARVYARYSPSHLRKLADSLAV